MLPLGSVSCKISPYGVELCRKGVRSVAGLENLIDVIKGGEIDIDCPNCGKSFVIELRQTDGKVACPHCGTVITFKGKD